VAARLVETARGLAPALRERSARAEADRRMPDETHRAFMEAGLYRIFQPIRFGGLELDYPASTWDVGEQEPQVATSSTGTATPKPSQPLPTIHGSSLPAG